MENKTILMSYIEYVRKYRPFANKLGLWFLECKYNPEYKYCKERLEKEYEELYGNGF